MSRFFLLLSILAGAIVCDLFSRYLRKEIAEINPDALIDLRLDKSGANIFWLFPSVYNSFFSNSVSGLPKLLRFRVRLYALLQALYAIYATYVMYLFIQHA